VAVPTRIHRMIPPATPKNQPQWLIRQILRSATVSVSAHRIS